MKDTFEFFLRIMTIVLIPFFIIIYALYGFRIWCWYFIHVSTVDGNWNIKIPDELKVIKAENHN